MADVAHDAVTRFPTTDGTTGTNSVDTTTGDRTFSHAGSASATAATVMLLYTGNTAVVTGVLYGGVAMSLTAEASDTTEAGHVQVYTLTGGSFPSGTQTVTLQGCTATAKWATCCTVTGDNVVVDDSNSQDTTVSAAHAINLTNARNAMAYGATHQGNNAPATAGISGCTLLRSNDYGTLTSNTVRWTSVTAPGTTSIGVSLGSDDWCFAAVAFSSNDQTVTITSGIASGEAFGSATEVIDIAPTAIASGEALGSPTQVFEVAPTGIVSGETFGTLTQVFTVEPTAIASAETFGVHTLQGDETTLSPTGISSTEAFGTLTQIFEIAPTGIASGETFGTATQIFVIEPTGIPTVETFGLSQVNGDVTVSSIASTEAFGTASVSSVEALRINDVWVSILVSPAPDMPGFGTPTIEFTIAPTGISTNEAFGSATQVFVLEPSSIPSAEAFGSQTVTFVISPTGIASGEAFGTATQIFIVEPSGVPSAEAFGTATQVFYIDTSGITSAEAFGSPTVETAYILAPTGIASGEQFGTATQVFHVDPSGIASSETFGTPIVAGEGTVSPTSIPSSEAFGTAQVNGDVTVPSIPSAEVFGSVSVELTISPNGIPSAETFGTATVVFTITCTGIPSGESFGTPSTGYVCPTGIPSGEFHGTPFVDYGQGIEPERPVIVSAAGHTARTLHPAAPLQWNIYPSPIESGEIMGVASCLVEDMTQLYEDDDVLISLIFSGVL